MTAPANSIAEFYETAVTQLESAGLSFGHGCTCAEDEVAWLLSATLDIPFDELDKFWSDALTDEQRATLTQRLNERCATKTPLAYILGEAWLGPYIFKIDRRVIVPRSFIAELLADPELGEALDAWLSVDTDRVLDLCTGNGSLGILAALAFPDITVQGLDLSKDALAVAQINIARHGLEGRMTLAESDGMAQADGVFDLILCNPPYVNAHSMSELPAEFKAEPALALAGGDDGMDFIRQMLRDAPAHMSEHAVLVLEIGHERDYFEAAFPHLDVVWLSTSAGDDQVLLLTRQAIVEGANKK